MSFWNEGIAEVVNHKFSKALLPSFKIFLLANSITKKGGKDGW